MRETRALAKMMTFAGRVRGIFEAKLSLGVPDFANPIALLHWPAAGECTKDRPTSCSECRGALCGGAVAQAFAAALRRCSRPCAGPSGVKGKHSRYSSKSGRYYVHAKCNGLGCASTVWDPPTAAHRSLQSAELSSPGGSACNIAQTPRVVVGQGCRFLFLPSACLSRGTSCASNDACSIPYPRPPLYHLPGPAIRRPPTP
jgi:hypothetical protein